MTPDIIIGVDGGETTGLAVIDIPRLTVYVGWQGPRHVACDILADWEIDTLSQVLVSAEHYTITPQTAKLTQQQGTIKVNGAIDWVCHRRNWVFEDVQSPASAKKRSSDEDLKEMGLYVPTRGGHANDASRHMILAIERHIPSLLDDETLFGYNGRIHVIKRPTGS